MNILLILFTVLTNFFSQIMLKKGMTQLGAIQLDSGLMTHFIPKVIVNPFIIFGMLMMVISMATHLVVLSRVDISYAYPFLGLSFVLITLWGGFVLAEPLSAAKIFGVVFICVGVALVARS